MKKGSNTCKGVGGGTVEPPIRDPLGTHHANTLVYYFTSEIGTTSLQGTKLLAPKCPLFRGFTVQYLSPGRMGRTPGPGMAVGQRTHK